MPYLCPIWGATAVLSITTHLLSRSDPALFTLSHFSYSHSSSHSIESLSHQEDGSVTKPTFGAVAASAPPAPPSPHQAFGGDATNRLESSPSNSMDPLQRKISSIYTAGESSKGSHRYRIANLRANNRYHSTTTAENSTYGDSACGCSNAEVHMITAHYLWEGRRNLAKDLAAAEAAAEGNPSSDPISGLLRKLRALAGRLFALLPLDRLSDYLVLTEATSSKLDEATKVAAQLLNLVEDLYLACAGEKALEGDRGPVVSLERLHNLNSIFAQPSEEDRSHISFLESCLSNPANALAASYTSLEEALGAILRIKPMECKLRGALLRSSPKTAVLTQEDECDLLCRIASRLASPVQSPTAIADSSFSIFTSDILPLFEMLAAPFIMVSKVGTADVALDTANPAAESLLKSHTNGPLSGFRFFLPPYQVLDSGGAQSPQVAQWFQEVAAGLKAASATPHAPGSAVEASIDWLRGPGGLREVSVKDAVDGQEALLSALQQGTTASSTGVPLVLVDVPSNTIFGIRVHFWKGYQRDGSTLSWKGLIIAQYVLRRPPVYAVGASGLPVPTPPPIRRPLAASVRSIRGVHSSCNGAFPCYSVEPEYRPKVLEAVRVPDSLSASTSNMNVASPEAGEAEPANSVLNSFNSFSFGYRQKRLSRPSLLGGSSSIGFLKFTEPKGAIVTEIGGKSLAALSTVSAIERRGTEVDEVRLACLKTRLMRRTRTTTIEVGRHVPLDFIMSDSLLLHVLQDVLQHNKGCGREDFKVMLHSCGMHLVVDLVPKQYLLTEIAADAGKSYEAKVEKYYQDEERGMMPHRFFDDSESDPDLEHVGCGWIDGVIALSRLQTVVSGSSFDSGIRADTNKSSNCRAGEVRKADVVSSTPLLVTALPRVWATEVEGAIIAEDKLVPPSQYLAPPICDLLISGKAAVVLMPSGAATIAFPYITQARVALLKEMNLVHQPLSAAEDLGIMELNRMADEIASMQNYHSKEMGKRGKVVDLGYGDAYRNMNETVVCQAPSIQVLPSLCLAEDKQPTPTPSMEGLLLLPRLLRVDHGSHDTPPKEGKSSPGVTPSCTPGSCPAPLVLKGITLSASSTSDDSVTYDTRAYNSMLGDPRADTSFVDYNAFSSDVAVTDRIDYHHTRLFLMCGTPCEPFISWLISIGHCVTVASHFEQVESFLKCGLDVYDVVVVEWANGFITPEVQDLLQEAKERSSSVPVFYSIVGPDINPNTISSPKHIPNRPALPFEAISSYVLYGVDIRDSYLRNRFTIRSHIRMGRIMKDLKGDDSLRFQIKKRLGNGSFGDVYEVRMYASKGRLALKRIPLDTVTAERMEQLYKEATIMRELDHRNIVHLSHITCSDTTLQIFMELCDCTLKDVLLNVELESRITDTHSFHTPLRYDTKLQILKDLFNAVNYLHGHDIVHRDLKPQNILFLNGVAKLADFGSATTASARQKPLHAMKGTVPYMAPEVFLGEPYRKSCDIWSLGILIGEIIGLRFAHTALLHFPALQAFYKSFSENESMPVVVTNVSSGTQSHFSDDVINAVKATLKEARKVAKAERKERLRKKADLSNTIDSTLVEVPGTRTVFAIEVDAKIQECIVSQHSLSASLIELLESTFYRTPSKRVTAEQLLEHPIANEREWLPAMSQQVDMMNAMINVSGVFNVEEEEAAKDVNLSFSSEGVLLIGAV